MKHLDETTIAMFVDRKLSSAGHADVERHIDECSECRALIAGVGRHLDERPLALGSVTEGGHRSLDEPSLAPGSKVGRYVIVSPLGAGGMGTVYTAFDPQLDRKVAIKLLRRGAASDDDRARLLREAQALARVSHPAVVTVYDVGTHAGRVFIAMELVSGGTVRTWLAECDRTWREIVTLFVKAGEGLAAAHAAGLVHRDIKPDNILVEPSGRPRVSDFGLAYATSASRSSDPIISDSSSSVLAESITVTGTVVGTPAYMAPEQLDRKPTTARSDQFSLCVTLYEALYGVRPYMGASLHEIAAAMKAAAFASPTVDRRVPSHVRAVLVRGLAIEPGERFPSVGELIAALEPARTTSRTWIALAAGGALLATAGTFAMLRSGNAAVCGGATDELAGVWDFSRRNKLAASFAASPLAFANGQALLASAQLDRYARDWSVARRRACEDTRVRKTYDEAALILRIDCLAARKRDLRSVVDVLSAGDATVIENAVDVAAGLPRLDQCDDVAALREIVRPPTDPAVRVEVDRLERELSAIDALADAGKTDAALRARTSGVVTEAQKTGHAPVVARAQYRLGVIEDALQEDKAAEQSLRAAIATSDLARDDRIRARAWTQLIGTIAYDRGKPDDAALLVPQAEAAVIRVGPDPEIEYEWLQARAILDQARGNVRDAAKLFGELVSRAQQLYPAGDPAIAEAMNNLAVSTEPWGAPADILTLAQDAVAAYTRAYGPDHPDTAEAQVQVATAFIRLGRYEDAASLMERAVAILERAYGKDAPQLENALVRLGSAYRALRRLDDSTRVLERVRAIRTTTLGPDHPLIAEVEQQLALVAKVRGDLDKAVELHRDSIRIVEAALGSEHPFLGSAHFEIAQILRAKHDNAGALVELQRSLAIDEKALGPDSTKLAETLTILGDTKLQLGDGAGAVPPLERALALRTKSPEEPVDLARIQMALARALSKTGDRKRARQLANESLAGFEKLGRVKDAEALRAFIATLR